MAKKPQQNELKSALKASGLKYSRKPANKGDGQTRQPKTTGIAARVERNSGFSAKIER
jgi:hypothetical protein